MRWRHSVLSYNKNLKELSRNLRSNMTDAEKKLWFRLRKKQMKEVPFTRQKIIGTYIVDFYCPKAKLVIELDGGQHYSKEGKLKDAVRDNYLNEQGILVLRFSDIEVLKNLDGVLERIYQNLTKPP
jgi:very-short-patch-repair endonuclease